MWCERGFDAVSFPPMVSFICKRARCCSDFDAGPGFQRSKPTRTSHRLIFPWNSPSKSPHQQIPQCASSLVSYSIDHGFGVHAIQQNGLRPWSSWRWSPLPWSDVDVCGKKYQGFSRRRVIQSKAKVGETTKIWQCGSDCGRSWVRSTLPRIDARKLFPIGLTVDSQDLNADP